MPADPLPPHPTRILTATSLAHFVNDGTVFFVPVIVALLVPLRHLSPIEASVLFVVYYATSSLLGLVIGWWADRRGRPAALMVVGIALLAAGLLGFAIVVAGGAGSAAYPFALVAAGVTGFGASFYHPLGAALLQGSFSTAQRGSALGINGAFGSLGRALYPFLFFLTTLVLVTGVSILPFVILGLAVALVLAVTTRNFDLAARHRTSGSSRASDSVTAGILALTGIAFVRSVALQGVAVWIPIYLTVARGVPATGYLGLAVTVMYVGGILGQPVFGYAANRWDRRMLVAVSSLGASLATFGYLFTSGDVSQILLFAIGVFTFSAFPLLMTLSADYVPRGSSSLANALVFNLGAGGGTIVGPLVVGALAASSYAFLGSSLEVMAALGIGAAGLTALLPRARKAEKTLLFG